MRADESKIRRAIVTVAVGKRENVGKPNEETIVGKPFAAMLDRWQASFEEYGEAVGIRAFTKSCCTPATSSARNVIATPAASNMSGKASTAAKRGRKAR